ncbi:MAG: peptidylprolyl isomerase [Oscillospiraceae bacterium]|nr:peptidylprolyl isomerase [Oscillospiraceae bacterium]
MNSKFILKTLQRIGAAILCISLLFTVFVGCKDDNGNGGGGHDHDNDFHGIDLDAAMATFAPDTVMIKAGEAEITWAELYVIVFNIAYSVSNGFTEEIDWDEEYIIGTPLIETAMEVLTEQALELLVYEYAVNLLGLSLSQEEYDIIQTDIEAMIEMIKIDEDIENLEEYLHDIGFIDIDVFRKLREREFAPWLLLTELYGEDIIDFPDEGVAEFAKEQEFMRAQHILFKILTEEEGASEAEIEESKIEKLAAAEDVLAQLTEHKDDEDFIDLFRFLMTEHSEDPGSFSSPNGYLFQPYHMVAPFSAAAAALEYNHISGIVTTDYGYHIILRLPIDYDANPVGERYSLRQLALLHDFGTKVEQWQDAMPTEFTAEFNSINLREIFAWCDH